MEIDPLPQVGDILRGLIGNARDVVLVNQHRSGTVGGGRNFLDVNDGAIGDAADGIQPSAAFELDIFGMLGFAAQKRIAGQNDPRCAESQSVETNQNQRTKPEPFNVLSA